MKNKKLFNSEIYNQSFAEHRFALMGGGGTPAPGAAPKPSPAAPPIVPAAPEGGKKKGLDVAKKKRIMLGAGIDTSALAEKIETQKKAALDQMLVNLNEWKISAIRRSNPKINADKWDISSPDGLNRIKKDWVTLQICTKADIIPWDPKDPKNKGKEPTFYQTLFGELGKSANFGSYTNSSVDSGNAYQNPTKYRDKLPSLTDAAFVSSFSFYEAIRGMALSQDIDQKSTHESQQEKGKEPILNRVAKGISDNSNKLMEAIKNRDYPTAAVYVIGIYAIYKAYKILPETQKGWVGKIAAVGGAAYAINLFAKNTGVDIGEKLGIKDSFSDIDGTPLAALWKVDGVSNLENLDSQSAGIMRDIAFVNLGSLYGKYQESNAAGKSNRAAFHFIDPAAFGQSFPEFRGMRPTDIAGKKTGLTSKQKNYREAGQKLYTLVQAMEEAYNASMRKPGGPSFEEALKGSILKSSTVFDFMVALQRHAATSKPEGTFVDIAKSGKVESDLTAAFEGKKLNFGVEAGELKPGTFAGHIMDTPIVIKVDGKNKLYRVFSKADYDANGGNPHVSLAKAEFPIGGTKAAMANSTNKLVAAITKDVRDLKDVFNKQSGNTVTMGDVTYSPDGYWVSTLDYKRGKLLKGKARKIDVKIKPGQTGTTLQVTKLDNEVLVHIEDVMDKGKLHGSLVLSEMVQQSTGGSNLTPLLWFYQNRQLKFTDGDPSDNKFKVKIGNVVVDGASEFEMKFDGGVYSFVDPNVEAKLIKDHVFRRELSESIAMQGRLNDVTKSFRDLMEKAPESFFINFFKSVPKWFTEATWNSPFRGLNLKDFTGSVPKNYFLSLLDSQKALVLSKFNKSLDGVTSLADVASLQTTIVDPAVVKLEQSRDRFSSNITGKESGGTAFGETEFLVDVVEDLVKAGTVSEDYRTWYLKFANDVFDRYGKHDGSKGNAMKAAQLINVFSHYTAFLDKAGVDGSDPSVTFTPEMVADIKKLDASVKKLGNAATKAQLAADSGIAITDIDMVKTASATKARADSYKLSADYVNYVSGRIFLRMNEGSVAKSIPEPGAFWRIDGFEEFKLRRPSTGSEIVDSRPRLKTNKDFTTFDKYLKMTPAQRARVPRENIILPRSTTKLVFKKGVDKAAYFIYKDLVNQAKISKTSGPGSEIDMINLRNRQNIEMTFHHKMIGALNALKAKYPDEYRVGKFEDLAHDYSLSMAHSFKRVTSGSTLVSIDIDFVFNDSLLTREVAKIEGSLNGRNIKTITRGMQDKMINDRVAQIIKNNIENNANFDKYFDRNTIPKMAKSMWVDVKKFLFG